jgi:hypothetical protein
MSKSSAGGGLARPRKKHPQTPAQRMRAYRARKRAAGLKRAAAWVPTRPDAIACYSDHRLREARSLALHCLTAQKIERDPALLDVARRNLQRWTERAQGEGPRYLREWREILELPWPAIAEFITSFGERAVRLRQSSPFAGILTPHERRRVYDAFRS